MGDDFRDLNLDKLTRRGLKTPEQITTHSIDTNLENRPIDRALHLLTVGDELQKISVMKILPRLIKEDLSSSVQRVIPRMQQTLPNGTTEYNMAACEAVRTIAFESMMSPETFSKMFLQHILNSVESRDAVAAGEWFNVLLDVIQIMPTSVLMMEVLPVAINNSHISKSVAVRIKSCKILGRLALAFPVVLVQKDLMSVVISLCQDVSGEVRAAMAVELPNVTSTLGMETGQQLLNPILDLVFDEDIFVRRVLIEAMSKMLQSFTSETLKNTIIPVIKKIFAEVIKNEDFLLVSLTKFFGQYIIDLKSVITSNDKAQFLSWYIQLSQLNAVRRKNPYKPIMDEDELALRLTECRLNCAYNMPAMVVFSVDMKKESLDSLFDVFKNLASDSYWKVRRKIAAGFFEVMKLMPKWHGSLKSEFVKLLKDDMDLVLEGLVPNVSNILLTFSESNILSSERPEVGKDVGQGLFICEKNLSETLHWRLHEAFLLSFKAVPKVFHAEFIYMHFVPLLISRAITGRVVPCRVAALHALLTIVADPSQKKQRPKIRNKILDLCNSSSFHCRMIFLHGMMFLIDISPDTLKELFFQNITSMAEDKVTNVRVLLCQLLPKLNNLAANPVDLKLLANVDACVKTLSNETNQEVLVQLKLAIAQIDASNEIKSTSNHKGSKAALPKKKSDITMLTNNKSFTNRPNTTIQSSQYAVAQKHSTQRSSELSGRASSRSSSVPVQRSSSHIQVPSSSSRHVSQRQPFNSDSKKLTTPRRHLSK